MTLVEKAARVFAYGMYQRWAMDVRGRHTNEPVHPEAIVAAFVETWRSGRPKGSLAPHLGAREPSEEAVKEALWAKYCTECAKLPGSQRHPEICEDCVRNVLRRAYAIDRAALPAPRGGEEESNAQWDEVHREASVHANGALLSVSQARHLADLLRDIAERLPPTDAGRERYGEATGFAAILENQLEKSRSGEPERGLPEPSENAATQMLSLANQQLQRDYDALWAERSRLREALFTARYWMGIANGGEALVAAVDKVDAALNTPIDAALPRREGEAT